MSDTFQIFLDSGAAYLAIGAFMCVVLGVGAARRVFRGAKKFERGKRNNQANRLVFGDHRGCRRRVRRDVAAPARADA